MKKIVAFSCAALSLSVLCAEDSPDSAPKPPLPHEEQHPDEGAPGMHHHDPMGGRPDGGKGGKFARGPMGERHPGLEKWRERRGPGGPGGEGFRGGEHRPAFFGGEMLARGLNLTDEQKEKAKTIMEATKPKLEAIMAESREKARGVIADAMKELRPLLTPEQQAVFDDLQKLRADQAALEAAKKSAKEPEKPKGE